MVFWIIRQKQTTVIFAASISLVLKSYALCQKPRGSQQWQISVYMKRCVYVTHGSPLQTPGAWPALTQKTPLPLRGMRFRQRWIPLHGCLILKPWRIKHVMSRVLIWVLSAWTATVAQSKWGFMSSNDPCISNRPAHIRHRFLLVHVFCQYGCSFRPFSLEAESEWR